MNPTVVGERIEEWKRKLVDLSRRNRLIHFRASRNTSVRIVDELPPETFRMTVQKRASMMLLPRTETSEEAPADTGTYAPYTAEQLQARHIDRALQTDLTAERLEKVLLTTYRKASAVEGDHGYNVLYLALGFLEWYESESSDEMFSSPLFLVPVELERKQAGKRFSLKSRDDDPIFNPALAQRLRREFSIPTLELPDNLDEADPRALYNEMAQAIEGLKRWRMTNSVYLGLFSFTKFTMYKDLEAHGEAFANQPLIAALSGDPEARQSFMRADVPRGEQLDSLHPRRCYHVMDIDSSQQEAIEAAKAGCNLVIEGPPGTGKSQTIANLVAECLLEGKSVLFVSEKMAALDVVYRRLADCGLGDFCLELHSHKTSRRRVIEELRRVLELPRSSRRVVESVLEDLVGNRDQLNCYVRQLREPVAPLGISPYTAFGFLAATDDLPEVPVFLKGAGGWDAERLDRNLMSLRNLARNRGEVEPLAEHPWRGVRLKSVSYEERLTVQSQIDAVLMGHAQLERLVGDLAAELDTDVPTTLPQVRELVDLGELLIATPRTGTHVATDQGWDDQATFFSALIETGREFTRRRKALLERYTEDILGTDADTILVWWRVKAHGFLRFLRPQFWRYRAELNGWRRPGASGSTLGDLTEAVAVRELSSQLEAVDGALLGERWRGGESDWQAISDFVGWMARFRRHVVSGLVSNHCLEFAANGFEGAELTRRVARAAAELDDAWGELVWTIRFESAELSLEELRSRVEAMSSNVEKLEEWTRYWDAFEVARGEDTTEFLAQAARIPNESLEECFERQFYRSWIEAVLTERPALREFEVSRHEELIDAFRSLDAKIIELNRIRARSALLDRLPDGNWEASNGSDLGLLQREVRKKRGHVPLRKLFSSIPRSLRRLKPCLMMSPLSVAQFLDPGAEPFDVVVFDEASQISPEDAVGAIARGRQLIVVGDSKQLPPTAFFRIELPDREPGEEELGEGDLESILDECASVFPDHRLLRWHYRSRHESLITFSNHVYYGRQLFTFPSPTGEQPHLGVKFVHVDDGVYDRGGSGKNKVEAGRIARAVFDQLKRHPDKSVGVGTFSVAQQEAVEDALEELRREDSLLEAHFDHSHSEYVFVKNLESIQGDERDVIFLSVGYGKDAEGKMSMNFGPLNQQGGARRLNVLVTRAREMVAVYSSIVAEDIDLARTTAQGVENLRCYLDYARRGMEMFTTESEEEATLAADRFAQSVARALAARDLELVPHVGCSGYKVDLGIRDAERWLLGVECDGPTYQQAATARDRDRLRTQVMEMLGWRLHRVWSPAWFRNSQRELDRILSAIDAAHTRNRATDEQDSPPVDDGGIGELATQEGYLEDHNAEFGEEVQPYLVTLVELLGDSDSFYRERVDRIARALRDVVKEEGPIHRDEASRRVAAHWGIDRVIARVDEVLDSVMGRCLRREDVVLRGEFLWPPGMEEPPIRHRDASAPRAAELIAPEEIGAALMLVLRKEFRAREDALIDRAARLLGFSRTGSRVRECVKRSLELLLAAGRIVENYGEYALK